MNSLAAQQSGIVAYREVVCPLCFSSDLRTAATFENKFLLTCQTCQVSFVNPPPPNSAVVAHFQGDDVAEGHERERRFEKNRKIVLGRVAAYIHSKKNSGSILDVGCATGYFLTRFFPGHEWRISGVELSRRFAEQAAENGVSVYCGDISQAPFAKQSFDVITVLDTFYYFPDPRATLAELHHRLKPEGLLLLELPLARSRIWRATSSLGRLLSGTQLSLLESSDHLFYYEPGSIARLMGRCGFQVQAIRPLPGSTHSDPLRNAMNKSFSALSVVLNGISGSRLFLGPRFLVVAAKA
jgi:SAM-dependent methyltransferase